MSASTRSKITFGLIGYQHNHAKKLIESALKLDFVQLRAVAESDNAKREELKSLVDVPVYTDPRKIIEDEKIDAIGVVTRYNERAEIICQALECGKHVIVDKPMCIKLEELKLIEELIGKGGQIISMMLTERFNPYYITVKNLYEEGAIGQVVSIIAERIYQLNPTSRPQWMFDKKSYGGIIIDLAIHDIDLISWLTNENLQIISAKTTNKKYTTKPDFNDYGSIHFISQAGADVFCIVAWLAPKNHGHLNKFTMVGTDGFIELDTRLKDSVLLNNSQNKQTRIPLISSNNDIIVDFFQAIYNSNEPAISTKELINTTKLTLEAERLAGLSNPSVDTRLSITV